MSKDSDLEELVTMRVEFLQMKKDMQEIMAWRKGLERFAITWGVKWGLLFMFLTGMGTLFGTKSDHLIAKLMDWTK